MNIKSICFMLVLAGMVMAETPDPRYIPNGRLIHAGGYADQPYVVVTPDGNWLCVLTTGSGLEGETGQHIAAVKSTDKGRTWSEPVAIEPAGKIEASWAMPLLTPFGRVYVFYDYNGDDIRTKPDGTRIGRSDMLGWFCYKYSDDYGQTWSENRYRLPVRTTAVDRRNDWNGKVHILWGIGKPITTNGVACLAFTKMGKYPSYDSEGWIFRSDNILTEKDPDKIKWQMLPDGDHGLRNDNYGDVHAEQNLVPLDDGSLFCMYRTVSGYPMTTYSRDDGHTWDKPTPATYTPNGKPFKHPRACPRIWKAENGKYLFWFHNHGGKDFEDRNPAWLSGGIEKNGFIHWSQPEIVLYMDDPYLRTSYPDLIEQDGKYWITETQKTAARVHEIDPTLLNGLWNQFDLKTMTTDGLVLDLPGSGKQMPRSSDMPDLPDFLTRGSKAENFSTKDLRAGFTLNMWLEFDDFKPGQIILDNRKENGQGLCLRITDRQTLELVMNDGRTGGHWDCDPGVLKPNTLHHVGIVVDGGPKIITFIVDGILNDGGVHRQFGWGRFSPNLRHTDGSDTLVIGSQIKSLLIYDRSLRTSEIVSNFQAGFKND